MTASNARRYSMGSFGVEIEAIEDLEGKWCKASDLAACEKERDAAWYQRDFWKDRAGKAEVRVKVLEEALEDIILHEGAAKQIARFALAGKEASK